MSNCGAGSDPILSDDDLAPFVNASSFATRLEHAKKIATLAVEKSVARGLTMKSISAAEVLFKYGETAAEKELGLTLLMKHFQSSRVDVVAATAKILKKTTRRAALNSSAVGSAMADARRARLAIRAS